MIKTRAHFCFLVGLSLVGYGFLCLTRSDSVVQASDETLGSIYGGVCNYVCEQTGSQRCVKTATDNEENCEAPHCDRIYTTGCSVTSGKCRQKDPPVLGECFYEDPPPICPSYTQYKCQLADLEPECEWIINYYSCGSDNRQCYQEY